MSSLQPNRGTSASRSMTQPQATPVVSVVVPVKNGAGHVQRLCDALDAQTLARDRFEIIFVDDASTDGTRPLLERWIAVDPSRRRLVRGDGKGPAAARNRGVDFAAGEWIVFTDSDTIPYSDWLEAVVEATRDTDAGAIEGAVEAWPRADDHPFVKLVANDGGSLYLTANLIVRRDPLLEVGGFDERFSDSAGSGGAPAWLEDRDLAARLLAAGVGIVFAPAVRVRHPALLQSARGVLRTARRHRWIPLYASKHPERYRAERSWLRPLSHVEIDQLIGLLAAAALPTARGVPSRAVLSLVAANGIRKGLSSGRVLAGSTREAPARALVSLLFPILKTFWWFEGCVRFRTFTW
jgi:glycosyltransferase involved in cell wall biosynthesis